MADTKISGLPAVASALMADEYAVNEAGTSKKATLLQTQALLRLVNASTTDQTVNAATLAYITNSNIAIPVGKLRIGSAFVWDVALTKTAAGTAANIFHIRLGTAGTTADTAVCTFTTGLGTAVADTGVLRFTAICRGPLSASGIIQGTLHITHNLQTTGLLVIPDASFSVASAAFDVTTANLIIGLSCTTAASTVFTVTSVIADSMSI